MSEKKKIFIVEDDEAALISLKKLLILSGFEVDITSKPKDTLQMIRLFRPDLILLDLLMPEIDGIELCEMLNNEEQTRNIPIIILSALGGYADIKKAYKLGVVGYLTKPYDFEALKKEIEKALAHKTNGGEE